MVNIQELNSLDEALSAASKDIKPLSAIEPINEKEEKKAFFAGQHNPIFQYKTLEALRYDPISTEQKLNSIETPNNELGRIFEAKRKGALLENEIIVNRGNSDIVVRATIAMHGAPSSDLVKYAHDLLKQIPASEDVKDVPSGVIKESLEAALHENGISDWQIELADKKLTTVIAKEKKITICKDRLFGKNDAERFKVHEVGVHALRAANGYEQPLRIFAVGLPGYLPTEEGLTTYFEELTGNTSEEMMRDYASRVIAVDSVCQGLDFRQTFDRLKSYDLSDDQSWGLAVRAHRGGGYVKDHVYLQGHRKIAKFISEGGDVKPLFVGKVGIEDLPLVERLLIEGILKEPKYVPHFLK